MLMKRNMRLSGILFATALIPTAAVLIALQFLPAEIPAHYDINMNIDRWGSKYETLLFPAATLVMSAFMYAMARFAAKQENGAGNEKVMMICGISINLLFSAMTVWSLVLAFKTVSGGEINGVLSVKIIFIFAGIVIAVVGNFMPKCKLNSLVGLRTRWSTANEDVWFKCQRFGGVLFVICGIMMSLISALADSITLILTINIIITVIAAAGSIVVSKFIYDRQQGNIGKQNNKNQ